MWPAASESVTLSASLSLLRVSSFFRAFLVNLTSTLRVPAERSAALPFATTLPDAFASTAAWPGPLVVTNTRNPFLSASASPGSFAAFALIRSGSSFWIVPRPTPSAITAPDGLSNLTLKVSFGSCALSPTTRTRTIFVCSPGANVSVSDAAR